MQNGDNFAQLLQIISQAQHTQESSTNRNQPSDDWYVSKRVALTTCTVSTLTTATLIPRPGLFTPASKTLKHIAHKIKYINVHCNKLCVRPHDVSPPLYAARCNPAPAHACLTYACSAQRALCHEYSWSTGSGLLWLWLWCRPYKVCSDLNSEPKWPGDPDLLTLKVVSESRVTWATSVPILVFLGLSVLELGPMYATDVR